MLYIFGFGTARLGEWRLNHIHSVNGAEVINASASDSSAEIDYSIISVDIVLLLYIAYAAIYSLYPIIIYIGYSLYPVMVTQRKHLIMVE